MYTTVVLVYDMSMHSICGVYLYIKRAYIEVGPEAADHKEHHELDIH